MIVITRDDCINACFHWADAQADLSLRWAHSHFVGFVTRWLNYIDTSRYSALISRWQAFILDICVGAGAGGSMGQFPHKQYENDVWPPMTPIVLSLPRLGHPSLPHISKTFLRQRLRRVVLRKFIPTKLPRAESSRTDLYRADSCRGALLRTDFPGRNV